MMPAPTLTPVDLGNGYAIYDVADAATGTDYGRVWRHPRMRMWKADTPFGRTARKGFTTPEDAAQWLAELHPDNFPQPANITRPAAS